MSGSIRNELESIIYGAHYDAAESRANPALFRARMEGVRAANQRWSNWLQKQGYTVMQAAAIISADMDT
jgi:hypothetical protein